jgi:hypothetical protein
MLLLLGVKTDKEWINEIATIPIVGGFFLFAFIFIPPVIGSFAATQIIPYLNNDTGFTKAMFIFLPSWNLLMWYLKIRLFLLFIPAWLLFGIIAIIKLITRDY